MILLFLNSFLILLVSISFPVNIGKEMSLPGFRTKATHISFGKKMTAFLHILSSLVLNNWALNVKFRNVNILENLLIRAI